MESQKEKGHAVRESNIAKQNQNTQEKKKAFRN